MNDRNDSLNTKVIVFDGNNWNQWMIQMHVLFGTQNVLDLVNDSYVALGTNATGIVDSKTAKAVWNILVRHYDDDTLEKKVKLQSLRKQYENLNVKNNEKDLSIMRAKVLQSSLEAQELRLTERTSKREVEQTLKESSSKKNQKHSWLDAKKRHDDGYRKLEVSNSDEKKH
ncbi:uncharacterized protein LOC127080082 [Lathyrus oleraceus]|uniref:uncharacterized protein LOC127080082 n=1 Tax=Pisum sativum TaxID=3888 RepID=UPI0021CFDE11|nr:uncharacterized protein LOC127080082 [Pisum sativum]